MSDRDAKPQRLRDVVQRFEHLEVLVVGDVMIDQYLNGEVERVSPEAPVPVVAVTHETNALGGAGNVVRNLAALGARPKLCSVVGDDAEGRLVVDLLKELGVETSGVVVDAGRPTTRKTRIVARDQQMIRADREHTAPLSTEVASALDERLRVMLPGVDGVAGVDYAKGVLAEAGAQRLIERAREIDVPVAVDPKGHLDGWAGARLVKPNLAEARALLGGDANGERDARRLALRLRDRLPGTEVALTCGAAGMVILGAEVGAEPRVVPTASLDVYDVQGAGDTSLAALWLARLAGATLVDAALLAHAASGVAVAKVGTATASRDELLVRLDPVLAAANEARSGANGGTG